ncbi:hypothetical protein THAOC_35072 [Thalassiosira oceanica]|uniref:SAP domain-containing protein n=1 Tax=Thalassiosira oceanica TaxID=159749 RepID=K0RB44_THAOC|nr:hypothetical protein THAOC_35072 [Thalassiosira oceanica]|eukprot:EJK46266.1 hypothetical protein THAOC_35072 [Thalassiosira oceanica]
MTRPHASPAHGQNTHRLQHDPCSWADEGRQSVKEITQVVRPSPAASRASRVDWAGDKRALQRRSGGAGSSRTTERKNRSISMSTRLETVQVGAPTGRLSDWVIAPVQFNSFERLTTVKGAFVSSPVFSCFGHQWVVMIHPGGDNISTDGYVSLYLGNQMEEAIEVQFKFIAKHPNGGEDICMRTGKLMKFAPKDSAIVGDGPHVGYVGYKNFALRSALLNYLVNGALIVEVHMRTHKPGQQQSAPFVPENPTIQNMLKDFGNEATADVEFDVGGTVETAKGRRKRAKTPTKTFHAHHYPLRLNAPALADMCQPGDVSPAAISNVRPEIFKHLLYYCYGGKIGKDDLQSDTKDIIEAADRFGIINLKLEAEVCYVDTVELTLDNIVEVVTYADSKNLALLKEHCMDFLSSANKIEAAEKVSFDGIPSHLMKDLMVALARREGEGLSEGGALSTMRVSQLRKLAHEKGLSVDGSREMLIDAIKDDEDGGETES